MSYRMRGGSITFMDPRKTAIPSGKLCKLIPTRQLSSTITAGTKFWSRINSFNQWQHQEYLLKMITCWLPNLTYWRIIYLRQWASAHYLLLYISSIYEKRDKPVAKIRQLPGRQFYFTTSTLARLANIKYVQVQVTISYCSLPHKACIDKYANPTNCISNRVKAGRVEIFETIPNEM